MKSSIIPDYDNYTIYENGDIYSKVRRGGGGKLTSSIGNNGYCCTHLTKDSISSRHSIHRLLAICFIPNPENKPCVDHIDRDRTNNDLSNLRWATYKENNNNKEKGKGSIYINKRYCNGEVYKYIRFCWREDEKKKSKNFKSIEDAENYRLNLFL